MKVANFAEIADVFYDTDFISSAAQFFCYLEFIEKPLVLNRSKDVKSWLYDILGYSSVFTDIEREALSHIKNAGELLPVVISKDDKVRLFAIELESVPDRSIIAYTIHCIFSKEVGKCSTILFRQTYRKRNYCMFSMDVGKDIILSDWLTEDSEAEKIFDISAENLSCDCSENFQMDMADIIGRGYYRNTFSKACIYDLLAFQGDRYKTDGHIDWEALRDDVENYKNKAIYDYGDDYVDPKPGDGKGEKVSELEIPVDVLLNNEPEKDDKINARLEESSASQEDNFEETDPLLEKLKGNFGNAIDLLKALNDLEKNENSPKAETAKDESAPMRSIEKQQIIKIEKPVSQVVLPETEAAKQQITNSEEVNVVTQSENASSSESEIITSIDTDQNCENIESPQMDEPENLEYQKDENNERARYIKKQLLIVEKKLQQLEDEHADKEKILEKVNYAKVLAEQELARKKRFSTTGIGFAASVNRHDKVRGKRIIWTSKPVRRKLSEPIASDVDITNYETQIHELNTAIYVLEKKMQDLSAQIDDYHRELKTLLQN